MSRKRGLSVPAGALSLFPGQPKAPAALKSAQLSLRDSASGKKLWLALTFPDLPLRALIRHPGEPTAVVETQGGQCRILRSDPSAAALGVLPGLKLNAAYVLVPQLEVHARERRRETRLLEFLAGWARRFTSLVSLERPDALLLEVGGSLRLFGGLQALESRLRQSLERWQLSYQLAVAPYSRAALWLARGGGCSAVCADQLVGNLSTLTLAVTGWSEKPLRTLKEMGITTVGDCLRLPRDGLARRLGPEYVRDLDRALGKHSDPRLEFRTPQRLTATLQFPGDVEQVTELQEASEQLLREMGLALRGRQVAVREVRFTFQHLHHGSTVTRIATLEPSFSTARFARLLKDRLEQIILPAPVIALSLRTSRLEPLKPATGQLFSQPDGRRSADTAELIECLRNRFGAEAVYGLCLVPEHRPESAWAKVDEDLGRAALVPQVNLSRPLWMLQKPVPLVVSSDGPCYEGALSLKQGPERIETGWWDGRDVARDYYHARNPVGMDLWIYRQRRGRRGWYLHGIFG